MKLIERTPNYAKIEARKLQVDLFLASPAALYNQATLDGILARAVVMEATQGKGLEASNEPYYIPLPIQKLWVCPKTFAPLWNATQFFAVDGNQTRTAYWHKRGYRAELLKKAKSGKPHNANFGQGRHKEYRMPLPVQTSLRWRAFCVGDMTEVWRLLRSIKSIGKKRTQGFGLVAKWHVTEINSFSYFHEGRFIKTFPTAYPNLPEVPPNVIFSRYEAPWTPPYWLQTLFQDCIL